MPACYCLPATAPLLPGVLRPAGPRHRHQCLPATACLLLPRYCQAPCGLPAPTTATTTHGLKTSASSPPWTSCYARRSPTCQSTGDAPSHTHTCTHTSAHTQQTQLHPPHSHAHTHTHTRTHTRAHTHTHTRTYTHTHARTHAHACIHTHAHTHAHTCPNPLPASQQVAPPTIPKP